MIIKIQKKILAAFLPLLFLIFSAPVSIILFLPGPAIAQMNMNGMYQNYNAVQTSADNEFIAARNRLRMQMNRAFNSGRFHTELDLIHRYGNESHLELQLREVYFDWFFDNYDLRLGKQNIIWGRANGGFLTDILSPVDLREFLTQDPEDLRFGITALNLTRYFGANSLQFIMAPVFQPDLIPPSDSRWFPIEPFAAPFPVKYRKHDEIPSAADVQLAIRYGLRSPSRFDLDLMLLHWSHPLPAYALTINFFNFPNPPGIELTESYQRSLMAGFSASADLHPRLTLNAEALFVKDKLFTFLPVSVSLLENALNDAGAFIQLLKEFEIRDDGYLKTRAWLNAMAGIQTEWLGTSISVQGYLETVFNYDDSILSQKYFPYLSFLAVRSFLRDRLQILTVNRYHIYAEDFWFQLQGIYELSDGLELALGTNLFGGDQVSPFYGHFSFNRFKENSFLFSRIAFYF